MRLAKIMAAFVIPAALLIGLTGTATVKGEETADVETENNEAQAAEEENAAGNAGVEETGTGTGRMYDLDLYRSAVDQGSNAVFSPYSLTDALHLLYPAAGGETKTVFETALGMDQRSAAFDEYDRSMGLNEKGYGMQVANRAFVNRNLAGSLNLSVIPNASTEKISMDQSGQAAIDAFVNHTTNGMIPSLNCSLTGNEPLVLVNALYFHRIWEDTGFEETGDELKWQRKDVVKGFKGTLSVSDVKEPSDKIDVFRIPYGKLSDSDHRYSMVIIADNAENETASVREYVDSLTGEAFDSLVDFTDNAGNEAYGTVYFRMPEFSISSQMDLGSALKETALSGLFSEHADFSALGDVGISDIVQAAKIEVTKEGTKAAAATGIIMFGTALREPVDKHIVVRDYFVYVLRDDTAKTNLFIGCVAKP
jgi:serine protease inhibitor